MGYDLPMISMSEHREISEIVNNMPNDYAMLNAKVEELTNLSNELTRSLATQHAYIHLINVKIDEMDKSKIYLDEKQEANLRKVLERVKAGSLKIVSFIKEEPMYDDGYYEDYEREAIIKIKDECVHETCITTLSNHAFNICCEVLGEPLQNKANTTWIIR